MRTYLVYVGVAVAAVIICGAWARWACAAAFLAYEAGKRIERLRHLEGRIPGQHRSRLLQPSS